MGVRVWEGERDRGREREARGGIDPTPPTESSENRVRHGNLDVSHEWFFCTSNESLVQRRKIEDR